MTNFEAFLSDALQERLVAGLRDEETQHILFATGNLTFYLAHKIVLEKEIAAWQATQMHELATKVGSISTICSYRNRDKSKKEGTLAMLKRQERARRTTAMLVLWKASSC